MLTKRQCAYAQVLVAMSAIRDCEFALVDHFPYSSELASSDYYLYAYIKKKLNGKRYQSGNDVISAVEYYFEGQEETFFKAGIQMLKHR